MKPEAKTPPKPAYRSPEEIMRSWKQKHPAPDATARPQPQMVAKVDAGQIAARISGRAGRLRVGAVAGPGSGGGPGAMAQYYDVVGDVLHGMWDQPSRAEVGKGQPTVTVSVTVLADGRVTLARVLTSSGVSAMDNSVNRVLKALERLPPFTEYGLTGKSLEFSVVFELD